MAILEGSWGKWGRWCIMKKRKRWPWWQTQKDHPLRCMFINSFSKYWLSIRHDPCSMDITDLRPRPHETPSPVGEQIAVCKWQRIVMSALEKIKPVKKINPSDGINEADDSEEVALEELGLEWWKGVSPVAMGREDTSGTEAVWDRNGLGSLRNSKASGWSAVS